MGDIILYAVIGGLVALTISIIRPGGASKIIREAMEEAREADADSDDNESEQQN